MDFPEFLERFIYFYIFSHFFPALFSPNTNKTHILLSQLITLKAVLLVIFSVWDKLALSSAHICFIGTIKSTHTEVCTGHRESLSKFKRSSIKRNAFASVVVQQWRRGMVITFNHHMGRRQEKKQRNTANRLRPHLIKCYICTLFNKLCLLKYTTVHRIF